MGRVSWQRWVGVAVLPVIGFVLFWWGYQQLTDMLSANGPQFGSAPWWRVLGWLFTMIVVGFVFGLAVTLSRADRRSPYLGAVLVAALAPLAVVVHYFGFLALGWSPVGLDLFGVFLISPSTAMVSCVVLGLLAVAYVAPRFIPSD